MILVFYFAAVCADIVSTIYARSRGGKEGNPVLRASGKFWLPVRIGIAVLIAILWKVMDAPDWVLIVGAALYVAVAISNVLVVRGAK